MVGYISEYGIDQVCCLGHERLVWLYYDTLGTAKKWWPVSYRDIPEDDVWILEFAGELALACLHSPDTNAFESVAVL